MDVQNLRVQNRVEHNSVLKSIDNKPMQDSWMSHDGSITEKSI